MVATWEKVGQLVQRVTGTARRGAAGLLAGILMTYGMAAPDQAAAGTKNFEPVIYIMRTYRRIRAGWCAALALAGKRDLFRPVACLTQKPLRSRLRRSNQGKPSQIAALQAQIAALQENP